MFSDHQHFMLWSPPLQFSCWGAGGLVFLIGDLLGGFGIMSFYLQVAPQLQMIWDSTSLTSEWTRMVCVCV